MMPGGCGLAPGAALAAAAGAGEAPRPLRVPRAAGAPSRPQSATAASCRSPRLLAHLRAALASPNHGCPATDGRPQTGTGLLVPAADDAAGAVVRLARTVERGKEPSMYLLLECLEHVRGLEINAVGGDSLLWMVSPVLRAVRQNVLKANDERQALEAEVARLRQRDDQIMLQIEDLTATLVRSEAGYQEHLQHLRSRTQDLDTQSSGLAKGLAEVGAESEVLQKQVNVGLRAERMAWGRERIRLEAEVATLDRCMTTLRNELDIEDQKVLYEEQIAEANAKILEFAPNVQKHGASRRKVNDRLMQIDSMKKQLESIEAKKRGKNPSAGQGASQPAGRKKSPASKTRRPHA